MDTHSPLDRNINISLIIKNILDTDINNIQSLVFYNRKDVDTDRLKGLAIELYNSTNDPNLGKPLTSTDVITIDQSVYRYDLYAIDTYGGTFSDTDSITQIASKALALKEVVSVNNITGGLKVDTLTTTGNATIGNNLTLTGTQINFNSDNFISNTAGGTSGNHLVIFINGTEYKIKLENA